MVAVGGLAVLVAIAFVGFVAFGSRPVAPPPGGRVAVGRAPGAGGSEVLVAVGQCPDERVTSVLVSSGAGVRWHIISAKGSIDERYLVGGQVPTGFRGVVALEGDLPDRFHVVVALDRDGRELTDRATVAVDQLPARGVLHQGRRLTVDEFRSASLAGARCPGGVGDRRLVSGLFALAVGAVVVAYLGMVLRWWGGRRPG